MLDRVLCGHLACTQSAAVEIEDVEDFPDGISEADEDGLCGNVVARVDFASAGAVTKHNYDDGLPGSMRYFMLRMRTTCGCFKNVVDSAVQLVR